MSGLPARVLSVSRRLFLSLLATAAGLLLLAVPASAAPAGPVPSFTCAAANGDGTFTYFFGYSLEGTTPVTVPLGADNQVTPGGKDVGQPTVFSPGEHPQAFSTTTTESKLIWHLGSTNLKADSATLCTNVAVVAEAPAALVMPLAAAAPFLVWFAAMRRRSRRTFA